MPEQAILDATAKAVTLIKKQEAKRTRRLIAALVVVVTLGLLAQTIYLKKISNNSTHAIAALANLSEELAANQENETKANQEILCNIQATGLALSQGFSVWSKKFGVDIPPPPEGSENIECDNGVDPVFTGDDDANVMYGTNETDWMNGEGGNDAIYARGSGDTLVGDIGNDALYGGPGADYLFGGDGNDDLYSTINDGRVDKLNGGDGNDTCYIHRGDKVTSCEKVIKQ